MSGFFIALEGGEGAGKSTQSGLLAERLRTAGLEVVQTREPGGTPAGEAIRAILLDTANDGMDPRAEALLFAAARAEHAHRVIRPAIERGAVVITDRYIDSSIAYQGGARGLGVDAVKEISLWATRDLLPDLTVLLDVDPERGLSRADDHNRMEAESLAFHHSVRQSFLQLAGWDPARYLILDAMGDRDEIAERIFAEVIMRTVQRVGSRRSGEEVRTQP